MSTRWRERCTYDPIEPLLSSGNEAIRNFAERDLLGKKVESLDSVWNLPEVLKIVRGQLPDGSWKYPGQKKERYPAHRYHLIETWKRFRFLAEQYETNLSHGPTRKAAEFLFSCQSREGDIRGFIGNQYATYYTGAIVALLNKAGFQDDPRVERAMNWLMFMRQDDGGWTVPVLTRGYNWRQITRMTSENVDPVEPDRRAPFSHSFTGMVLRAFATHEKYRESEAARRAALLLAGRFFERDSYSSYGSASHWVRFQFPFWWNNLLSALDTVLVIGVPRDHEKVARAARFFVENQQEDGLWRVSYSDIHKAPDPARSREVRLWVSLAVCRVLKRYYND